MKNLKLGFTLAEVLITLAIIGVVAALTLPTLMSNYRKHEVETKLQKFYATMQQAIKMSTVDNGPTTEWPTFGYVTKPTGTPETLMVWFNKYLAPYISFSSVEVNNSGGLTVAFHDGSYLDIKSYLYDWQYKTHKCEADENCRLGVELFKFRFSPIPTYEKYKEAYKYTINPSVEPMTYAWDGTFDGAKYSTIDNVHGCYEERTSLCAKLIQLNGWKIPNDYPYHF